VKGRNTIGYAPPKTLPAIPSPKAAPSRILPPELFIRCDIPNITIVTSGTTAVGTGWRVSGYTMTFIALAALD